LKAHFKNLMKRGIGWSYSKNRIADAIAVKPLQTENQELLKIFVTIAKSSKKQSRKGTK